MFCTIRTFYTVADFMWAVNYAVLNILQNVMSSDVLIRSDFNMRSSSGGIRECAVLTQTLTSVLHLVLCQFY